MDRPLHRLRTLAAAFLLICAASAVLSPSSGASSLRSPAGRPLVGFGCANTGNHGSLGRVLAPVEQQVSRGVSCFGRVIASTSGRGPAVMSGPTGLSPAQIQSAYDLAGDNARGRTVAIVDAYDDPNAASDLNTFRAAYGLPACGQGCFTKVNESGQPAPLPAADAGWSEEISLDLDAVSSACPTCHILLVEASTENPQDLDNAESTAAATPGVAAISNSYGGTEDPSDLANDPHFSQRGIAITASAGDSGYGVSWPASSPNVTAVGGTTLTANPSTPRGWTETAWPGTGSGCSAYEPKPSWQTDPGCGKRTVTDVSADADPTTGIGIYDTENTCGNSSLCDALIRLGLVQGLDGWSVAGGTSLSSPLIAGVYALAGNTRTLTGAQRAYAHPSALNDITAGANGNCRTYLCTAGPGYDGPTGLGSPHGTGAF